MNDNKKSDEELVFHKRSEMIYKIIVIGDPAVGKTSLLTNFCGDKFQYEYVPTVGVNITKQKVTVKNDMGKDTNITLMIWDVAGQPQFYMLHRPYFNGADGMILVYDVTRSSSFSNVNNWYSTAVKYGLSGVPRVLIGNKIDLKDEKKIILPMAEHLSQKLNAPFFETSAMTGENVAEMFIKIGELTLLSKLQE
jgi:small GTP-binding protein